MGVKNNEEMSRGDLLVTAATLKYKMGYSQARIAEMLGVSSMTISRMLDSAIEQGIVEISVKTPVNDNKELSREVRNRYGLMDALIVRDNPYEDAILSVAKAAAFFLDLSIGSEDVLGVAAGRTLSQVMPYMTLPMIGRRRDHFKLVQLQGGYTLMGDRNPTISIINFANRFGIKGQLLQHPMYTPTEESAKSIHEHYGDALERMWRKCTLLVTGVGTWGPHSIQREEKLLSEADIQELDESNAVGDLFGRWFDKKGEYIDCSCNRKVISIYPHIQREIPRRVLVASGDEKIRPIHLLLEKSMMNILITNEYTGERLLELPRLQ